jgi:hypothetical protein
MNLKSSEGLNFDRERSPRRSLSESIGKIRALRQTLAARDDEVSTLKQSLSERIGHSNALRSTLATFETQVISLDATIKALDGSTSSRVTAPLRAAKRLSTTTDRDIGIIFPDGPHVVAWGLNRRVAEPVARQLGIGCLPKHFHFRVGSMFWVDVGAVEALFKLDLNWSDYPNEPLPCDGTLLHGIERLLSLAAMATGKRIALTNVPGVTR